MRPDAVLAFVVVMTLAIGGMGVLLPLGRVGRATPPKEIQ